jgi:hypothetical protein
VQIDQWLAIAGLIGAVVGIIVSGIAIWLSIVFYREAQKAATQTNVLLTKVEQQSDNIKTINHAIIERLLTTVTHIAENSTISNAPEDQKSAVEEALKILTYNHPISSIAKSDAIPELKISGHGLPNLSDPFTQADLENEYINVMVNMFVYAGCSNNYAQFALPFSNYYDATNTFIRETLDFLDRSHTEYFRIRGVLIELEKSKPEVIRRSTIYQNAINADRRLSAFVRNASDAIADKKRMIQELGKASTNT